MARIARISTVVLVALGMWGCKSDLDVTAPYQNITLVYALLNAREVDGVTPVDTHYVKINKAFLGEGNAFDYAEVPDSTEYKVSELQAEVQKLDNNGNVTASYPLDTITIRDREPGTFPTVHRMYFFVATLDPEATYRFHARAKGTELSATTPLVDNITPNPTLLSPGVRLNFATNDAYSNYTVRWTSAPNGKRYDISYRFNYAEVSGTDTLEKSFTRLVGTAVSANTNGNEAIQLIIPGEDFYRAVAAEVPAQSAPNVTKRLFRSVDLLWAVGALDLHVYLQLSSPISGIVEERPQYTNVTNGYGLFTSRYFREVRGKQLSDGSALELINGQYTGGLSFCIPGGTGIFACE